LPERWRSTGLGRFRDRSHESHVHCAAAPNLVTAATVLWNIRYLGRALEHLHQAGEHFDEQVLRRLSPSPLGWDHIDLTGGGGVRNLEFLVVCAKLAG
jgi:hypothetical protein